MKLYYPGPKRIGYLIKRILLSVALLLIVMFSASAQNLVFKNPVLISGVAGKDGAVYRFPLVTTNVDALVQISGRSSSLVELVTMDLPDKGWDKAFQPQVSYNRGTTPGGINDWYMEFQVSFVKTNTATPVIVNKFDITALDIDGNGDQLNEYVSFYNLKTSVLELNSLVKPSTILESILGLLTIVGKKFEGPTTNFVDIDTASTRVMVSTHYENANQFKVRTGGHSVGQQGAADRMYSFWFKSFNFQVPVQSTLPVVLSSFTAKKTDNKVILNWTTDQEKNLSHFVIERSLDGTDYTDAGLIFTDGNSDKVKDYSFTNDVQLINRPIIYYRLKMVDLDGSSQRSAVRIIKTSDVKQAVNIQVYPNPVVNELRITYPQAWQDKKVSIDLVNANGQTVKHVTDARAGQTETLNVSDLVAGIYFVRASNGTETTVQRILKTR